MLYYRKDILGKNELNTRYIIISDFFESDYDDDFQLAIENSEKFIENEEIDN